MKSKASYAQVDAAYSGFRFSSLWSLLGIIPVLVCLDLSFDSLLALSCVFQECVIISARRRSDTYHSVVSWWVPQLTLTAETRDTFKGLTENPPHNSGLLLNGKEQLKISSTQSGKSRGLELNTQESKTLTVKYCYCLCHPNKHPHRHSEEQKCSHIQLHSTKFRTSL